MSQYQFKKSPPPTQSDPILLLEAIATLNKLDRKCDSSWLAHRTLINIYQRRVTKNRPQPLQGLALIDDMDDVELGVAIARKLPAIHLFGQIDNGEYRINHGVLHYLNINRRRALELAEYYRKMGFQ